MPVSLTFNGTSYLMPLVGDSGGWGQPVSAWFADVSNNALTLTTLNAGLPTLSVGSGGLTVSGLTTTATLTVTGLSTLGLASSTGLNFGNVNAASTIDLSKHIALSGSTVGFDVTTTRLNYVVPAGTAHKFVVNAVDVATVDVNGITTTGGVTTEALTVSGAVTGAGFAGMLDSVGRNLLDNAQFNIVQRSNAPWTTTGSYTADRWLLSQAGTGTSSVSIVTLGDADRTAIGDEAAINTLQIVTVASSGVGDQSMISQPIESVRRLSGKTVTVSFWAIGSGSPKIGIEMSQVFGTGGSPSASVTAIGAQATAALTATWTRYTATITIPSSSGKTFGTTVGSDYTLLNLWLSGGSSFNARNGSIGEQSSTVQIWGVQMEVGTLATPLAKLSPADDLDRCQRFYFVGQIILLGAVPAAGYIITQAMTLPVSMRTSPTLQILSNFNNGILSSPSVGALNLAQISGTALSNNNGNYQLDYIVSCDADF